ncbi:hypothetical protein [Marinobacter oulmenensis]|uniref:Uncharacterized protein n=1 Tax=Marinobacter oulmenensis TaxID=643747 RepID=A0A840UFR3_9GAMM|nr:hypothetical protein [Marinobacter oulmenensis]MBB5322320.1 hypothetical protein [Marinobacter oulmenensis]
MRLRHIPILGLFLKYLNLYAGQGKPEHLHRVAPAPLWLDRVLVELIINLVFVALLFVAAGDGRHDLDFSGLAVSVFPSLLGFGIGVFALIFVLPDDFLTSLDKRSANTGVGSTLLVADMAFPLIYLAFGLAASAIIEEIWPSVWGQAVLLLIFLYGLTLVCDLISGIASAAYALRHRRGKQAQQEVEAVPDGEKKPEE